MRAQASSVMVRGNSITRSEFQDAGCLLISEVHLFFSRPGEANERDGLSAYVHSPDAV